MGVTKKFDALLLSLVRATTNEEVLNAEKSGEQALKNEINKNGELVSRCDNYVFYQFVNSIFPALKAKMASELRDVGISAKVWEGIPNKGFKNQEKALKAFAICSKYKASSYLSFFIEYINFAKLLGAKLYGLKGFDDEISELLEQSNNFYSNQPFSDGLSENLKKLNSELNHLTVDQVRALESTLIHRKLWIEGEAGTGKTIFAVEAAYRTLRAGQSVLIIYRSSQFKKIFSSLLSDVDTNLFLVPSSLSEILPYLKRDIDNKNYDSFLRDFTKMFPEKKCRDSFFFDLIIADDVGTYPHDSNTLQQQIENISHRKIILAAPEQVYGPLLYGCTIYEDGYLSSFPDDKLKPPKEYHIEQLRFNLRNAASIAEYSNFYSPYNIRSGVITKGFVKQSSVRLDDLSKELLFICSELLDDFSPNRIKILVDPGIRERDEFHKMEKESFNHREHSLLHLVENSASRVDFINESLLYTDDFFEQLSKEIPSEGVYFAACTNHHFFYLEKEDLPNNKVSRSFTDSMNKWVSPHVDSQSLFRENALYDPFPNLNAILIYPAPFFIGLESDVVIYLRNDTKIDTKLSSSQDDRVTKLRNSQHYLSMTRAKFLLVDLVIT